MKFLNRDIAGEEGVELTGDGTGWSHQPELHHRYDYILHCVQKQHSHTMLLRNAKKINLIRISLGGLGTARVFLPQTSKDTHRHTKTHIDT